MICKGQNLEKNRIGARSHMYIDAVSVSVNLIKLAHVSIILGLRSDFHDK